MVSEQRAVSLLPLVKPDVGFDEVAPDIRAILESGRLTNGPYVRRFEAMVAEYVGTRHAVATTSATTALHLALVAAGIGDGDEVLASDFTYPATGNAIVQSGAVPVMVDCRPGHFDLDVADAGGKVTAKTRAIVPVDPFGQPADMAAVTKLAERHGLFVLEDAACALGAEHDGRRCGAWPGAGCFSFHPRKIVATGEGGMITTDDDALAERLRLLRNQGCVSGDSGMSFEANGYNYRMSEIQAALGVAQMKRIDAIIADRRATAALYMERLRDLRCVSVPLSTEARHCTFQSFVILLDDGIDRDAVIRGLRDRGIESTLGTYAMHAQPSFARFGYQPGDLPNAWRAQRQSLTLPLVPRMERELVEEVVEGLAGALAA